MAKAEAPRLKGIVVQREPTAPPDVNIRNYVDLLWVVGAGVLGVSLLCVTAGIALANPNTSASLQSQSIIELAIANVNTAAALTVEAVPPHLLTPQFLPTNTLAPKITFSPTATATVPLTIPSSITSIPGTSTHRPRQGQGAGPVSSPTPIILPTQTNSPLPPPTFTNTPIPSPTITDTPRPTRTPRPTNTSVPPPTTEVPPPTTEVPPPTTEVPPPTTEVPPPTTEVPPPTAGTP